MKSIKIIFAFVFTTFIFLGCSFGVNELFVRDADIDQRSGSIKYLSSSECSGVPQSGNFNFVIFTDIHFGHKSFPRHEQDFLNWLDSVKTDASKKPSFCVCLGDIADHGYADEFDDYVKFTNQIENHAGIKTYTVVGNHDLYNNGWQHYKTKVFPYSSFYKFSSSDASFYFIDSASGSIGKKQFNCLKSEFESDSKMKIVFSHFPLTTEGDFYFRFQNLTERNRLMALVAKNNVRNFFSGHTHDKQITNFGAFEDSNFPSISKNGIWVLVSVNQNSKTVSYEVIKK